MLAAAEAAIDAAAEDENERKRTRAKLYAPPKAEIARRRAAVEAGERPRPAGGGMTLDGAQALMAQMAAQDAQLTGGRSG
jgi:hypothetical protein